jgi:hypothetical protein
MYERMLNKEIAPSLTDIYGVIGSSEISLFEEFDQFLRCSYDIVSEIRFPFGDHYGWGIKYSHRTKHLCYVFPENGAFTVTIQIGKSELAKLYGKLPSFLPKTKELWENRYPCGAGGWLHYRVLDIQEIADIKELIRIKKSPAKVVVQ